MLNRIFYLPALFGIVIWAIGCSQDSSQSNDRWLSGSSQDKFDLIEKHLRGFDMAMVETGYRYAELYWAGHDENWQYATYQVEKLRTAIDNGIERRPGRAESAQMIYPVLDKVEAAIKTEDATLFQERFGTLTATCNACHQVEDVAFMKVAPPQHRVSPVGKNE